MPKVLTSDQIEQYRTQGFVSPIDVMSEDEACSYRQRFEAAVEKYPEAMEGAKRNNPHLSFKCLDELVHHPRILDAVEDLIGANISLWGSVMFVKEPKTPHFVSWHQDATYMGMNKNNFVTPWLALSASTPESGCMRMIPGSHLDQQHHQDTFAEDNILTRGQVVSNVDESKAVDLILRPGQMSLHHAMVVHDSQPNNSDYRRIGFAIQSYMSPDVWQIVGENNWMDIRGDNPRPNSRQLRRPAFDMDPQAQADLDVANANFAKILYNGSAKQGVY
jgi:ectoine hydroxylase-related dioxygenase (phytanoyl-CoA dioxygenase family)